MFEWKKLNISVNTRAAVLRTLKARRDPRDMREVLEEALQGWLEKAACDDPPAAHAAARGYQWKSLFLPEGTLVRFEYRREIYRAEIRGDRLVYEGRAYSPRQLLIHLTGTVRNAWRELWLRCPGDFRWHLADTRRRILRRTPCGLHPRGIDGATLREAQEASERARRAPPQQVQPGDTRSDTGIDGSTEYKPGDGQRNISNRTGNQSPNQKGVDSPISVFMPDDPASSHCDHVTSDARPPGEAVVETGPPDTKEAPTNVGAEQPNLPPRRVIQRRGKSAIGDGLAARQRGYLYRDDLVREDQPDLSTGRTSGGACGAGRSGKRDRRYYGYLIASYNEIWNYRASPGVPGTPQAVARGDP